MTRFIPAVLCFVLCLAACDATEPLEWWQYAALSFTLSPDSLTVQPGDRIGINIKPQYVDHAVRIVVRRPKLVECRWPADAWDDYHEFPDCKDLEAQGWELITPELARLLIAKKVVNCTGSDCISVTYEERIFDGECTEVSSGNWECRGPKLWYNSPRHPGPWYDVIACGDTWAGRRQALSDPDGFRHGLQMDTVWITVSGPGC